MGPIRLSATGVAEFIQASPATRTRKLQPFKYPHRGEGAGRSSYYKPTIDTVREYHRRGDPKIIRRKIEELTTLENDSSLPKRNRTRARRNIDALMAYEDLYGNRNFSVQPNHRLAFKVGSVTITAQPDLWVEENGVQVLIKLGVAKNRSSDYIDLLLHLIRKAAIATGYKVRARNIAYLNVATGEEVVSQLQLSHFNRTIRELAQPSKRSGRPFLPRQRRRDGRRAHDLTGKPDLVFPSRRKVILVHGCFWHMHDCRWESVIPSTNAEFWQTKRKGTVARDTKTYNALVASGWKVLTVWEWAVRDEDSMRRRLREFLGKPGTNLK